MTFINKEYRNNYKLLYRFLKDNDSLRNKKIYKQFNLFSKRRSIATYELCNFINHTCNWNMAEEGRIYWEKYQYKLFFFLLKYLKDDVTICSYFSILFFNSLKNEEKELFFKIKHKIDEIKKRQ